MPPPPGVGTPPPGVGTPPGPGPKTYVYPPPPGPPPRPHGLALAPLGPRFLARLIDFGILAVLNVIVNGWFIWQYLVETRPLVEEFQRRLASPDPSSEKLSEASPRASYLLMVIILLAAALWFAYEVPAVANTGQTLGKRLLRLKVVALESPEQLGIGRSLRRWNVFGLPTLFWICFGVGFMLQFADCLYATVDRPLQQALHDKSAHTVVVSVGPAGAAAPATTPEGTEKDSDTSGTEKPGGTP